MQTKVIMSVVKDDKQKGKWMVVIRYDVPTFNAIIGIPLRNVDKATARRMLDPIRFTFGYAVETARKAASAAIEGVDWNAAYDGEGADGAGNDGEGRPYP